MIRHNPNGDLPIIHSSSYIDPSAVIIGAVMIGRNVYVGPGAVIRADEERSAVVIGDGCNVQDRVIVHALRATRVVVGDNSSLAHGSIVHGPCVIGENCFIGFGSVVFGSVLERGVFIKHLAVVEETTLPEGSIIPSGSVKAGGGSGNKDRDLTVFARKVIDVNIDLARGYKAHLTRRKGNSRRTRGLRPVHP